MTQTNSLINMVLGNSIIGQPKPEVGMGVTVLHWTDRSAGTIVRVSPSGKTFWYTDDTAKRTDKNGMSEMQDYTFTSNPDGTQHRARLTKHGAWVSDGHRIRIGQRNAYHDYSF